jgi:hypothetical protein
MSFSADDLRRLQLADQAEDGRRGGGRPRTLPNTPQVEHKRQRQRAWLNGAEYDRCPGGRPRAPYVDEKTERRRERQRRYHQRRRAKQESRP